jgi:hypothetical protein
MIAQVSEELLWNQIVARAWCDEDFMNRLLSEPRGMLAENDLEVPPDTDVEVVLGTEVRIDDTDSGRRFMLPAGPSEDLMDEELLGDAVAYYCYSASAACGRCGACGCRCRC